jgi:CBS domain-containing protein
MNARDIMTSHVVTVTSASRVGELAALLYERRISAAPVVDHGRLVGIASEADLLHRYELGTDLAGANDPWWVRLFSADRSPEEYVKSHALRVRDIMTRDVATVSPDAPLAEVATLLERRRIRRVPVVEDGRLVGIVSRSDLVRALASARQAARKACPIQDDAIRERLLAELRRQAWWQGDLASVVVEEGVVTFSGVMGSESERAAARAAAETIPGVRSVIDRRLAYRDLPLMI